MVNKKPQDEKDKTPHVEAPPDTSHEDVRRVESAPRSVEAITAEHAQAQVVLATLKAQTPRDAEAVAEQKRVVQALADELAAAK